MSTMNANPIPRYTSTGSPYLDAAMGAGRERGQQVFYNDPDMQDLRRRRLDMAEGLNGQELGAMRTDARNQIAGQRSQYLRQLQSRAGRGGVGGARAAAMQGAADRGFQRNAAESERKMIVDNAALKRTGLNDLQDYYFRQKMGALGTELGYGQLSSAERAADAARKAAQSGGGGFGIGPGMYIGSHDSGGLGVQLGDWKF